MSSQSKLLDRQLQNIHDTMYGSPGFLFIKDCSGRFLYINKNMLDNANLTGLDSVLGKTDNETPWQEYSPFYQKADSFVVSRERIWEKREIIKDYRGYVKPLITQKKPFYCDGELRGVFGISLEIPDSGFNKNQPFTKDTYFVDLIRRKELKLTAQQKHVVHLVLQGLSSKEIARAANISPRTVEHHLNAIRQVNGYSSMKEVLLNVYPV